MYIYIYIYTCIIIYSGAGAARDLCSGLPTRNATNAAFRKRFRNAVRNASSYIAKRNRNTNSQRATQDSCCENARCQNTSLEFRNASREATKRGTLENNSRSRGGHARPTTRAQCRPNLARCAVPCRAAPRRAVPRRAAPCRAVLC